MLTDVVQESMGVSVPTTDEVAGLNARFTLQDANGHQLHEGSQLWSVVCPTQLGAVLGLRHHPALAHLTAVMSFAHLFGGVIDHLLILLRLEAVE